MPLRTVVDTLDGLEEPIAALYAESDGKFVLQLDDIESHPALDGLRVTIPKLRDEVKGKDAQLKELKSKVVELEKGAPDTAATQAKLTALQEQIAKLEGDAVSWRDKYMGKTRDQSLTAALQTAGISDPVYLEAATVLIRDKVKVDDDGNVYAEGDMGQPKMLDDFVKSFVSGKGAAFVSKPSGGGASGSKATAGSGITMTRTEFEALDPIKRAEVMSKGATLTE
jgi:hypothetical protein